MSQIINKNGFQPEKALITSIPWLFGDGVATQSQDQDQSTPQICSSYQFTPTGSMATFGETYVLRDKNRLLEVQLHTARCVIRDQEERNQQQDDCIKQLRRRVEELELQVVQERTRATTLAGMQQEGDPFFSDQDLSVFRDSSPVATPITLRNNRSYVQLTPGSASYTPTTSCEPVQPPVITGASPPAVRRHKRTETPEQRCLKQFTNGVPIYTFGIEQQNDRGLLHDFFEDIRKWAGVYTKVHMQPQEAGNLSNTPDLVEMMANKSDIKHLLMDNEMRKDIVTCLVTRHIVANAMSDNFLWNSGHHAGAACNDLCLGFANLSDYDVARKHEICELQRELYTQLKQESGHKEWRTRKAEEHCTDLLSKLGFLLEPYQNPQRTHVLSELYVKGFRIGFRLRMEAVKWQVVWPTAGTDLNLSMMVNRTRNLLGDPMKTLNELQKYPNNFFVRFALTPTFTKSDFSRGAEAKVVMHSSMVHVGRRGVFSHKTDALK